MEMSHISSSDSSDLEDLMLISSDDEEDVPRRCSRNMRRVNYMQSLDEIDFTFRFRLSKPAVQSLLEELMPFIRVRSSRNYGVSPLHQLLLSLRFYALGTMLISVADFVGVSKSSASRIVRDISSAIARLYDKYIFVHQNGAEKFYRIAGFPRVLGAIDCTHIRIQSPCHLIGEEFRNRKGYFSINVQGVCDADLRLMNVVARWPGSAHDATIFNNSILRVLSANVLSAAGGVVTTVSQSALAELDMVQEGEAGAGGDGLIAPRRLPNPYLDSPQRMDLHRELLFNQRIGKNVLNQKSELQKALSKHKEKQIMNQVKDHRETPELERAIAERARRLEQAEQPPEEVEAGTNPTLQELRARLRHAAPSPAASAH